jgi:transaldolase
MTLFLDSALAADAREAAALQMVTGITTNPTLVAQVLKADTPFRTRDDLIAALCDEFPGTVMVQLTAETPKEREAEGWALLGLRPGRVGLKIPSTPDNFPLARRFAAEGHAVGMTAIFGPGQAYLSCEAGVKYIFPYVNRSTRLLGDGVALVRRMRAVIDALQSPVQILAASVKSSEEAVDTLLAGAHGLTLPLNVMRALGHHPLSEQTIAEFAAP